MTEAQISKEMLDKDSASKTATEQKSEDKVEVAETKVVTPEPSAEVKKQLQNA